MRLLLCLVFCVAGFSLKAQTNYPNGMMGLHPAQFNQYPIIPDSSNAKKKWSLSKYGGISTGFSFFNGGQATFLSAPIGIQLNRRLNNNLYAFTGLSIAPSYLNFNNGFSHPPGFNKNYPGGNVYGLNQFAIPARVEMGLMYVNDQRTFSLSGSVGVSRYGYQYGYPAHRYNNFPMQQPVMPYRH
ncbi:hypothetical protein [Paraflavitalea speifideaquila]|uniref:hypothetical protein n=1 Tax=Paraflavitalea speifideaquila TaxID=3076558 RepID=UPI0028F12922|nr:hypothetical protein [Paraflavitalea speifideiaquila]